MNELIEAIQLMIQNNINAGMLADYTVGTVEQVDPLIIRVDQQELITEGFLVLTDAVRDYEVDISVNHTTENKAGGSGDAQYESHNHAYTGRKKITVHNGLKVGEAVYMIRKSGGQEFLVLGRTGLHSDLSGQWGE